MSNTNYNCDNLVNTFKFCIDRALKILDSQAITLSGGWDSRATCAVASILGKPINTVTFGVEKSSDVEIASTISNTLGFSHTLLKPEADFFISFHQWAEKLIILSQGHVTIDLAFQIYMYDCMSRLYTVVIDSAGCEFRRGIRARHAARTAKCTSDITKFLLSMYSTGIWSEDYIGKDFYHIYPLTSQNKLTRWLDFLSCKTYEEQIDAFSMYELWAHSYAHGYPLQTSIIACRMPFSDNEFYDELLNSSQDIRWSHKLHRAVIHKFAPQLEKIPFSYAHCKVYYGESLICFIPLIYHKIISSVESKKGLSWLSLFDNSKPFRPFHKWYSNELENYVYNMLTSSLVASSEYFNAQGVLNLLNKQKLEKKDYSRGINVLLTLIHLTHYVKSFK